MNDQTRQAARLWTLALPGVSAFVTSMVTSMADRDDVLQETAVAVIDSFGKYDPDQPLLPGPLVSQEIRCVCITGASIGISDYLSRTPLTFWQRHLRQKVPKSVLNSNFWTIAFQFSTGNLVSFAECDMSLISSRQRLVERSVKVPIP